MGIMEKNVFDNFETALDQARLYTRHRRLERICPIQNFKRLQLKMRTWRHK